MNDTPAPPSDDLPPLVIPVRQPAPRLHREPPPPPRGGGGKGILIFFLLGSIGLNLLLILMLFASLFYSAGSGGDDGYYMVEKFYSNDATAEDKVAVIQIDGVLMDEMMGFAQHQIDRAAKDPSVKAVVVRVNSPGGTITASDDLCRRLKELRDGNSKRFKSNPKALVTSMGAMAASGGYYISMPGQHIFAEKTTITGSIGVYVSLPNIHELADSYGVKMNLIKAGDVKDSGSMFHELTPAERQQWQDMVNDAYGQFLKIVEEGRPHLKDTLTKNLERKDANGNPLPDTTLPHDAKGNLVPDAKPVPYKRKLADGGIYTASEAKQYKLIDSIGYLEDAATTAASLAGLTKFKVITYERPPTLMSLLGASAKAQASPDWSKVASAAGPRLWYMAPNAELTGILAAMGKE